MNISKLQKKPKVFERLIGLSPQKFNNLVKDIEPLWQETEYKRKTSYKRKIGVGVGRKYKLSFPEIMALQLMYMRTYANHVFLGMVFNIDDSRVCRYFKKLEPALSQVMKKIAVEKIDIAKDEIMELILDATEQETERRNGSGYSGKKKKHTVKTQVVIDAKRNIKHISHSVKGTIHDKKLFDQTKLVLPANTKADLGYLGLPLDIPHKSSKFHKLTTKQKKENKQHSSARIVIEHVFASLKQFRILSQRFRNSLKNYNNIFTIVCGLHNLRLA